MAEFFTEKRVVISDSPSDLAKAVARRFLRRVEKRVSAGETVHVSLTGGVMAGAVLAAVGHEPKAQGLDWSAVHFWWSDERFLPRGDADRNDTAARAALLDRIDVPAKNIHPIATSDDGVDLDAAAAAYERELASFSQGDDAWPSFDVCFLGVGPDGHIASLFPDRPEILITDRAVLPVRDSPKPPADRITLTRPVINASKRVWLVVAGVDKAAALGLALAGASYANVPAAGAKGRLRTIFFVDDAAAAGTPLELIDQEY